MGILIVIGETIKGISHQDGMTGTPQFHSPSIQSVNQPDGPLFHYTLHILKYERHIIDITRIGYSVVICINTIYRIPEIQSVKIVRIKKLFVDFYKDFIFTIISLLTNRMKNSKNIFLMRNYLFIFIVDCISITHIFGLIYLTEDTIITISSVINTYVC